MSYVLNKLVRFKYHPTLQSFFKQPTAGYTLSMEFTWSIHEPLIYKPHIIEFTKSRETYVKRACYHANTPLANAPRPRASAFTL